MRRLLLMSLAALIAVLAVFGFLNRNSLVLAYLAHGVDAQSFDERKALIAGHIETHLPESGAGPFPVVMLFHGCAGARLEFQRLYAKLANSVGYAALIVDSNRPRGISRDNAIETICAGKKLVGQERAGDIAAAVAIARENPSLDIDRLIFAGWSHGGYSIMDYLTMDMDKTKPVGLTGALPKQADLSGVILFYPYCGIAARSQSQKWQQRPPYLTLLAENDSIVSSSECLSLFDRIGLAKNDHLHVYSGADHVFDDPYLEPEYLYFYNEEYAKDARARFRKFLVDTAARG